MHLLNFNHYYDNLTQSWWVYIWKALLLTQAANKSKQKAELTDEEIVFR